MASKIAQKELSLEQLKKELAEIKAGKQREANDSKLIEIAKFFASKQQWALAIESIQFIVNKNERNLLIVDLIENYLLPADEIDQAKKFAKYLTPEPEIVPLVQIRIALMENNRELAKEIAERLPSSLSRNYAFVHLAEHYLSKNEKNKLNEIAKLLFENARTIYDFKSRSYILREIALNLFLAYHDKEHAKEAAALIPNETIRTQVINKINNPK